MASAELEVIKDVNGNSLLPGEEVLIFSKNHPLPFYVKVYRNSDNKLCLPIDGKEVLCSWMIDDNQTDMEMTIPLARYEFKLID